MSIPTTSWDEASPAGSDNIALGDNRIREMKTQIREVINVDHDFPSSGQATDVGQHKKVTLQEQADLGTGAVNATILGSQTVAGKGELVYTDEDDNDIQITKGGKLYSGNMTTDILNMVYPVGSVVTLGVSTNPGTLYGVGTWTAIKGRVIVGISDEVGDGAFDTLNEIGGAQTVTSSDHTHTVPRDGWGNTGTSVAGRLITQGGAANLALNDNTSGSDGSESLSVLQPYIVKYCWERVS